MGKKSRRRARAAAGGGRQDVPPTGVGPTPSIPRPSGGVAQMFWAAMMAALTDDCDCEACQILRAAAKQIKMEAVEAMKYGGQG
ncbi:MAG: hypothetical protein J7L14_03795 [Candidatus Diapherotrites archaeon]|nr:hypothetical protein [Candidatus Diapherotrites archaeon]